MPSKLKKLAWTAAALLVPTACAMPPEQRIQQVICQIYNELLPVAQAIALLMFVYGGAKYVYSAEDPGGRKQAKSIAVNAIIGLVIVAIAQGLIAAASGQAGPFC